MSMKINSKVFNTVLYFNTDSKVFNTVYEKILNVKIPP